MLLSRKKSRRRKNGLVTMITAHVLAVSALCDTPQPHTTPIRQPMVTNGLTWELSLKKKKSCVKVLILSPSWDTPSTTTQQPDRQTGHCPCTTTTTVTRHPDGENEGSSCTCHLLALFPVWMATAPAHSVVVVVTSVTAMVSPPLLPLFVASMR